ncbi:MAG: hypothetical protein AAGH76_00290 [Pseudomonadota bacterium]
MWKNPHVVGALLAAPVLALLAYFAVDAVVREPAKPAAAGASYPLVAAPNCRRRNGQCQLRNAQLRIDLVTTPSDNGVVTLELTSTNAFDGVFIGDGTADAKPKPFNRIGPKRWTVRLPSSIDTGELKFVAIANNTSFYAELPAEFTGPD